MTDSPSKAHYVGFRTTSPLLHKLQLFLAAIDKKDQSAGQLYVDYVGELTAHINQAFLLEMVEIAEIGIVGSKVVNVCVSSSAKVSGMLTAKIYKKKSVNELTPLAKLWRDLLKNTKPDNSGAWYLVTPISNEFGQSLTSIFEEKGDTLQFRPSNIDGILGDYDKLSKTIIEAFFLEATRLIDMGSITKTMLSTGVSTVEKTIDAVLNKVIRPLGSEQFGKVVEHTNQFYVRL